MHHAAPAAAAAASLTILRSFPSPISHVCHIIGRRGIAALPGGGGGGSSHRRRELAKRICIAHLTSVCSGSDRTSRICPSVIRLGHPARQGAVVHLRRRQREGHRCQRGGALLPPHQRGVGATGPEAGGVLAQEGRSSSWGRTRMVSSAAPTRISLGRWVPILLDPSTRFGARLEIRKCTLLHRMVPYGRTLEFCQIIIQEGELVLPPPEQRRSMQGQGGAWARFVPHGGTQRPAREGFSSSRATMRSSPPPCLSSGSMKPERAVKKLKDDVLGVYPCIPLAFSDDCEAYGRGISECLLQTFLALNMVERQDKASTCMGYTCMGYLLLRYT